MGLRAYRRDRHYFLKYFAANAAFFALACAALVAVRGADLRVAPESWAATLALVPLGVLFGLVVSTAFHNAAHGNVGPRLINVVVGELAGAFTLEGMRNFRVGHQLHHRHADDPVLDPHPPAGQSFVRFLATSRGRTIACLTRDYYDHHGAGPEARMNIRLQLAAFHVAMLGRVGFWLLLFGLTPFLAFYVPAYLAYVLGFAHLNYVCHLPDEGGAGRIQDRDRGLYYRVMNVITSGGYFHSSHHRRPWLYNPSKGQPKMPPTGGRPEHLRSLS